MDLDPQIGVWAARQWAAAQAAAAPLPPPQQAAYLAQVQAQIAGVVSSRAQQLAAMQQQAQAQAQQRQ